MEMINHLVSPYVVLKICKTAHVPVAVAAFTANSAWIVASKTLTDRLVPAAKRIQAMPWTAVNELFRIV